MAERETSRSIDAAAAAWVAREDRARLTADEARNLEAWLEADRRHAGALLRARAVALRSASARALGTAYRPENFGGRPAGEPFSRRRILGWGGGALAASVAGATAVGLMVQAPRAHATERGEVRLVPLADGSNVMLNTASRMTVKYDDTRRRVRLVEGEADFSIVADRGRPFIVEAAGRRFVATGAAGFRLRNLSDEPLDILVHQGRVEMASEGTWGSHPVVLETNTRLVATTPNALAEAASPGLVTRELAWRDGKVAFEGETLAQAAAVFARYSDTRIVIEDPTLSGETVVGLFAANDPAGFGHAVAGLFGAEAEEVGGTVRLRRGAPRG